MLGKCSENDIPIGIVVTLKKNIVGSTKYLILYYQINF